MRRLRGKFLLSFSLFFFEKKKREKESSKEKEKRKNFNKLDFLVRVKTLKLL